MPISIFQHQIRAIPAFNRQLIWKNQCANKMEILNMILRLMVWWKTPIRTPLTLKQQNEAGVDEIEANKRSHNSMQHKSTKTIIIIRMQYEIHRHYHNKSNTVNHAVDLRLNSKKFAVKLAISNKLNTNYAKNVIRIQRSSLVCRPNRRKTTN